MAEVVTENTGDVSHPSDIVVCEVCSITLNKHNLTSHLSGKKHKLKQQVHDKNYKTTLVEDSGNVLDEVLKENIGDVLRPSENVVCEACNMTFTKANFTSHLIGKKHKLNQQLYDKKHKTIFVGGSGSFSREHLHSIFIKFGDISSITHVQHKNFSLIQFVDKSSVEKVLRQRLFVGRVKLFVKQYVVEDYSPLPTKGPEVKLSKTQVGLPELPVELPPVEQCPPEQDVFEWQVHQFIQQVELEPEKYTELNTVIADIEDTLKPVLPGCRVLTFGSCNSTLAFKNSDVDFYLLCVGEQPKDFVRNEAKLFYRKQRILHVVTRIPKARVPIIKLQHVNTGWQCDLTANSKLGLCNSQLIKFLMSLDPRIKPLLFLIKYWAKVCGLCGSGNDTFTAYSIVILVIFYLQQLSPPLLPKIVDLQKLALNKDFSNGWNCSFCDNEWKVKSELLQDQNLSSLKDLLSGFFRFYNGFDYQNVVCPLLGHTVPVSHFKNLDGLPIEMELYKVNLTTDPERNEFKAATMMRVQDPFELCLNITRNISDKTFFMFKKGCEVSCVLCDEKDDSSLLSCLLGIDKDSLYEGDQCIKIIIDSAPNKDSIDTDADSKSEWYDLELEAILLVMREVFKVKIEPYNEEVLGKVKKTHLNQDVHSLTDTLCSGEDLVYICSGNCDVVSKRKQASKVLNKLGISLNPFEKEVCISNVLLSNKINAFSFLVTISSNETIKQNKSIEITIATKSDKKSKGNSHVKSLSTLMKYQLKLLTKCAVDFIVQTKAGSPSSQEKGSLRELLDLRLAEIPNMLSKIDKNSVNSKGSPCSLEKLNNILHNQHLLLKSIEKVGTGKKTRDIECATASCSVDSNQHQERGTSQSMSTKGVEDQEMKSVLPKKKAGCAKKQAIINEFLNPNHPDQVLTLPPSLPNDASEDNLSNMLQTIKQCETESTLTSEEGRSLLASIDQIKLEALAFEKDHCLKNNVNIDDKCVDKKSNCNVSTNVSQNKKEYKKDENVSGKRCFPREDVSMESKSSHQRSKIHVERHHKQQKPNWRNSQNSNEARRTFNHQQRYESMETGSYREAAHFRQPHYLGYGNNSYSNYDECNESSVPSRGFRRSYRNQGRFPKPQARQ